MRFCHPEDTCRYIETFPGASTEQRWGRCHQPLVGLINVLLSTGCPYEQNCPSRGAYKVKAEKLCLCTVDETSNDQATSWGGSGDTCGPGGTRMSTEKPWESQQRGTPQTSHIHSARGSSNYERSLHIRNTYKPGTDTYTHTPMSYLFTWTIPK